MLCFTSTAFAAESVSTDVYFNDSVSAHTYSSTLATDYIEWPAKTDVPIDKVWTVTFNQPLDTSTENKVRIHVKDENNMYVSFLAIINGNVATVSSRGNYEYGKTYYLIIENVKGVDGNILKNNVRMKFTTQNDITPPVAPVGLKAESGDRFFKVSWQGNIESDLAGYRVYAGLNQNDFVMAKTNSGSDIFTNTYIQTNEADNDVTLYFYITAVDVSGNESARSEIVSVTPKALDATQKQINYYRSMKTQPGYIPTLGARITNVQIEITIHQLNYEPDSKFIEMVQEQMFPDGSLLTLMAKEFQMICYNLVSGLISDQTAQSQLDNLYHRWENR